MFMQILQRRLVESVAGLMIIGLCAGPVLAVDRLEGLNLDLNAGYRTDDFDWNIASDLSGGSTPNILSELTWEDLEIYQVGIKSDARISNRRVPFLGLITASVSYGGIFSGSNQDSDYLGDNRTLEFSRSNNGADDGEVWDLSVAAGPEFLFLGKKLALSPLLGYSYHEQNLAINDGFQTIPPDGPFSGLDSSYDAVWKGGWLGANLWFAPARSFIISGRFEWHLADYEAVADWNLRDDLQRPVSFRHTADDAEGLVVCLGGELALTEKTWLTVEATYMDWQAEDGIDTVYISDGSVDSVRLNEVNWKSVGLVAGLKMIY